VRRISEVFAITMELREMTAGRGLGQQCGQGGCDHRENCAGESPILLERFFVVAATALTSIAAPQARLHVRRDGICEGLRVAVQLSKVPVNEESGHQIFL
jgi:hypothetical protein